LPDFISIKEAKALGKGNIRFTVVSLGELKSGTAKSGDEWKKQVAVIKDASGAMNLTLWNENIGEIIDGEFYTLENAYWTEYKDEPQLSLGNFYKLNKILQLEEPGSPQPMWGPPEIASPAAKTTPQEKLETATQNEMIAKIFDMTSEMYHDFIDRKTSS